MGFMLPSSDGPAEKARALIARRAALEAELHEQVSILRANGVDGRSPLVDADGFPRADIDIWAVRHARVRALELRNDLAALTNEIGTALCVVYDPAARAKDDEDARKKVTEDDAFARVDGVTSGSPAARAGLQAGDLVLRFGHLTKPAMESGLQPLAALVAENENKIITVAVLRVGNPISMHFTPTRGWGGRGMLGCHLVPYTCP